MLQITPDWDRWHTNHITRVDRVQVPHDAGTPSFFRRQKIRVLFRRGSIHHSTQCSHRIADRKRVLLIRKLEKIFSVSNCNSTFSALEIQIQRTFILPDWAKTHVWRSGILKHLKISRFAKEWGKEGIFESVNERIGEGKRRETAP